MEKQQMLSFIQKIQTLNPATLFLALFFSTKLGTRLHNLCLYHAHINKQNKNLSCVANDKQFFLMCSLNMCNTKVLLKSNY